MTTVVKTIASSPALFTGLSAGTYAVNVTAHNSVGDSVSSSTVNATVSQGVVQPPASSAVSTTGTTATLTWTAPTTGAPSSYIVGRDGTDSTGYGAYSTTVTAATLSFTFASLVPGSTYNLSVSAVTSSGQSSSAVSKPITIANSVSPSTTHKFSAWTGGVSYENTFLQAMTGSTNKTNWWGRNYVSHDITTIDNPSGAYSDWKSAGYTGFIMGTPLAGPGMSCAQVAAGNADSHIMNFINRFNTDWPNGTGIVELGWETNIANEYPWCLGGNVSNSDYKNAFDHFASLVHAHSNLLVDWTVSTQSGSVPSAARPSDVSVDVFGADAYDTYYGGDPQSGASRWNKIVNNGGETLANVINQAKTKGKQWSVNEWGVSPSNNGSGGGDDPHYISNMMHLLKTGNDLDGLVNSNLPAAYDSYYSASYDILNGYPNSKAAYIAAYPN